MKKLILIFLFLLLPGVCFGATYYMATAAGGGNDGNDGSIGSPWLTFNFSESQLGANDTLYIRAGTYTETGETDINVAGVTIQNYQNEIVLLEYTEAQAIAFLSISADGITLSGLGIVRNSATPYHVIQIGAAGTNFTITNCTVYVNSGNPNTGYDCINNPNDGADYMIIEDSEIYNCDNQAIDIVNGPSYAIIRRNVIYDSQNGIVVKWDSEGHIIEKNLVYNTTFQGILLGGTSAGGTFQAKNTVARNNIVWYPSTGDDIPGLLIRGCTNCQAYNNIIYRGGIRVDDDAVSGNVSSYVTLKNNIIVAHGRAVNDDGVIYVDAGSTTGFSASNNLYYQLSSGTFVMHFDGGNESFATW